jgi:SAM-dependent methyltransferase
MVAVEDTQSRRSAGPSPYSFKASHYSSHGLVVRCFPSDGRGRSVLDLGCGSGEIGGMLTAAGYRVTGIDRPGCTGSDFPASVTLVEADLESGLPSLPGPFDYVLCADVLEHLRDPARQLHEIGSVLAPGGRLVASLPNSGNIYFRLNVLAGRIPSHDCGLFDRTHLHFYTWTGWVKLLAAAGFRIEKVMCTAMPVELALRRWEGVLVVRWLEAACYVLARWWKKLFAYQFVVVAVAERDA